MDRELVLERRQRVRIMLQLGMSAPQIALRLGVCRQQAWRLISAARCTLPDFAAERFAQIKIKNSKKRRLRAIALALS